MIDDTARPVSTYMLTLREIFSNEFGKNSVMVWTGNESQTGLIKTNNCSTKISFITKLYIYTWSCSVLALIDVHAYPEWKQNNFYYNIKTEIHRK